MSSIAAFSAGTRLLKSEDPSYQIRPPGVRYPGPLAATTLSSASSASFFHLLRSLPVPRSGLSVKSWEKRIGSAGVLLSQLKSPVAVSLYLSHHVCA